MSCPFAQNSKTRAIPKYLRGYQVGGKGDEDEEEDAEWEDSVL